MSNCFFCDESLTELCEKIDNSIFEVLNGISAHDDGSLKDYITAMNDLITNRD